MKKIMALIIVLFMLTIGCAGTPELVPPDTVAIAVVPEKSIPIETSIDGDYTYEGRLNPADFNNWSGTTYQEGPYGMVYILQNPRKNAAIKFAFVYIATNDTIISFAYIEDDKLRYFGIMEGSHYGEMDIPEKVRGEIKQSLLIMEEAFERSLK